MLLALPAVPLDVFDPFGVPPPFAGRLEMIGMGATRLEDAYEATIDALAGCRLFTMTQAKRLIGYFGDYASGDWTDKVLHIIAKQGYRVYGRARFRYRGRRESVYALTAAERRKWLPANKELVPAVLEQTEKRVAEVFSDKDSNLRDMAAQIIELRKPPAGAAE